MSNCPGIVSYAHGVDHCPACVENAQLRAHLAQRTAALETHPAAYDGLRSRHTRMVIRETGHVTNMCRVCGETYPCSTAQLLGERDGLLQRLQALADLPEATKEKQP